MWPFFYRQGNKGVFQSILMLLPAVGLSFSRFLESALDICRTCSFSGDDVPVQVPEVV